jgi:RNA polymerase sigma-70 factor (ECF subfamily)
VLLADQDRGRWDRTRIDEGLAALEGAARLVSVAGSFQLQAMIAAEHARAATAAATDWPRIVALYDLLLAAQPSPVIALNRAVAVAVASGPAAGLALVDELTASGDLADYHLLHSTRGELLRRLGRPAEAADAFRRAVALAANEVDRRHLVRRLAEVDA